MGIVALNVLVGFPDKGRVGLDFGEICAGSNVRNIGSLIQWDSAGESLLVPAEGDSVIKCLTDCTSLLG
jgi:hypothetical protein